MGSLRAVVEESDFGRSSEDGVPGSESGVWSREVGKGSDRERNANAGFSDVGVWRKWLDDCSGVR
jgi:hypothetical protein